MQKARRILASPILIRWAAQYSARSQYKAGPLDSYAIYSTRLARQTRSVRVS